MKAPLLYLLALTAALASAASAADAPSPSPARADLFSIDSGRVAPAYPVPYPAASVESITAVLDRVLRYLEVASPIKVIDQTSGQPVTDLAKLPAQVSLERGDFQIISYEWGVTYSGMLLASEVTGDARFAGFAGRRFDAIRTVADHVRAAPENESRQRRTPLRAVLYPRSLDDSGSMAAAMIKAQMAKVGGDLRPIIDGYLQHISSGQMRLADGTLARNRPLPGSLWLDDLYMSVPALAQMGRLTGETKYFDDAVKQVRQFSERMFVKENGLYMHGWVEGMTEHPRFHWARANGWALVAMVELLSVLPENHPGRAPVLELVRAHARGIAATQGVNGLWHQLLDRAETYDETSASAMFVYSLARAINRGWIDASAYGPAVSLGWNAVAQKVNAQGQVEGTCVGTGMGWDPAFYAFRPVSPLAAHGYGPVLLAGAETIALRRGKTGAAFLTDGAVHVRKPDGSSN